MKKDQPTQIKKLVPYFISQRSGQVSKTTEQVKTEDKVETTEQVKGQAVQYFKVPDPTQTEFPTKSAKIRYLASTGMKTADIARLMGIRYQHVRNTLQRPLKKETAV